MHRLLFIIVLFFSFISDSNSQSLVYKPNSRIYNAQGKRMSHSEIVKLFEVNTIVYDLYNDGRGKKIAGGVMMFGGLGLILTDIAIGASSDVQYPSALTIIGGVSFLISIPVKIGYAKRIKKSVEEFNRIYPDGNTASIPDNNIEFVANGNGLGFRLTLN